jgi:hypothetical protein
MGWCVVGSFGFRNAPGTGIPVPFDDRNLAELKAAKAAKEAQLADDHVLVEYAHLKYGLWDPAKGPYSGPSIEMAVDAAARTGRELDVIRHTLRVREAQAEDEHRRAVMEAQTWQYENDHGLPHPLPEPTADERHAAEQAAIAAQLRANGPAFDPHSKEGKRQLAAEAHARDPFRPGAQPVDAQDVLMGRVDGPGRR